MKYRCRTCKTTCDDIMEHIKNVHHFSESNIEATLKTKPSYYENCFEKIFEYKEKMANQTVTDDSFKESSTAFTSWMFQTIEEIKKILE